MSEQISVSLDDWVLKKINNTKPKKISRSEYISQLCVESLQKKNIKEEN